MLLQSNDTWRGAFAGAAGGAPAKAAARAGDYWFAWTPRNDSRGFPIYLDQDPGHWRTQLQRRGPEGRP